MHEHDFHNNDLHHVILHHDFLRKGEGLKYVMKVGPQERMCSCGKDHGSGSSIPAPIQYPSPERSNKAAGKSVAVLPKLLEENRAPVELPPQTHLTADDLIPEIREDSAASSRGPMQVYDETE